MIYQVADGVLLNEDEETGSWMYSTRWGDIRDVYAFIGSLVVRLFRFAHEIEVDELRRDAFTALYLAMRDYDGERPIGEYASCYVCRAVRAYIEQNGAMDVGQTYALVKTRTQVIEARWWPKEVAFCSLPFDAEMLPAWPDSDGHSAFWEAAEDAARATGKPDAYWLAAKVGVTGAVDGKECKALFGSPYRTMHDRLQRMGRAMVDVWTLEEAIAAYEDCR